MSKFKRSKPSRIESEECCPFPNKPVVHRQRLNPGKQDSLDLYDFEKTTVTEQPRGPTLSPKSNLKNIRETNGSKKPGKASHRLPSGEQQMTRAIRAKELMLQEKLQGLEQKLRQKIQRDSLEDAAGNDDMKSHDEKHGRGQAEMRKVQTKTRLSEQHRREAVRGRETLMQEIGQEDVKQLRRKQDQRPEDRMRNTCEEEGVRWKRTEREAAECPQPKTNGNRGTNYIKGNKQKLSGDLNKLQWENVQEHTRGKGHRIWGEEGVSLKDETEKAKERGCYDSQAREKKHMERTCKDMYSSNDERGMSQRSQQKITDRLATEHHRGPEHKTREQFFLPVSGPSPSSQPKEEELQLVDSADTGSRLLPCTICNRTFATERLEKHVQICQKVNQSQRQVFNSYLHRTKGSNIEEYFKTHTRSKTPEVLQKKNNSQNHKAKTQNAQQGRRPAGTSQPKLPK